jgi:hypothetical protein
VVAISRRDVGTEGRDAYGDVNPYAPPGVPDRPPTLEERLRNLSRALVVTSVMLVATVVALAVVAWLLHVASAT